MSLPLIIYLIEVADGIITLFGISAFFLGAFCFVLVLFGFAEDEKKIFSMGIKTIPFVVLFSLLAVLIPSKESSYTILAAYGVESIAENKDVQRLGGKSMELIEKTIDKYLVETE